MPQLIDFPGARLGAQLAQQRGLNYLRLGLGIRESRRAEVIQRFERARAEKEAKKAAKKAAEKGKGGVIGTLAGGGTGAIVGGLVGGPLGAVIGGAAGSLGGGAIGQAFDPSSVNPGPAVSSAFSTLGQGLATVSYDDLINQAGQLVANPPSLIQNVPKPQFQTSLGDTLHANQVPRHLF